MLVCCSTMHHIGVDSDNNGLNLQSTTHLLVPHTRRIWFQSSCAAGATSAHVALAQNPLSFLYDVMRSALEGGSTSRGPRTSTNRRAVRPVRHCGTPSLRSLRSPNNKSIGGRRPSPLVLEVAMLTPEHSRLLLANAWKWRAGIAHTSPLWRRHVFVRLC